MTKLETAQLLTLIQGAFPSFSFTEMTVKLWADTCKDIPADVALAAAKNFIRTSGSAFAPSIPQLFNEVRKLNSSEHELALEAWEKVRTVGRLAPHNRSGKLSDRAQRALQMCGGWMEYGMTQDQDLPFFRNRFVESFDALQERDTFQELSAPEAKKFLGDIGQTKLAAVPDLRKVKG